MLHYFTIKFHFSFFASFRFKFFASIHLSNFRFEAKQSEAKFKSFFRFFCFFSAFFALNFSLRFNTGFRPNAKIFNTQALNNFAAHKCTVRICTCIFTEIGTKESNLKTFLVLPSYSCERKGRNSNIYVFGP